MNNIVLIINSKYSYDETEILLFVLPGNAESLAVGKKYSPLDKLILFLFVILEIIFHFRNGLLEYLNYDEN
jgi:hypothetical protein